MTWRPTKVIEHRAPSGPATCERDMDGYPCGMPLLLYVGQNPTNAPFEDLVIIRCPWHTHSISGVERE